MHTINVKSIAHWNELVSQSTGGEDVIPIVVRFTATWCGPCKAMAPLYELLAAEFTDFPFLSVDIDDLEDVASKFDISSVPTIFIFQGGQVIKKTTGASQGVIDELRSKLFTL
jgi:thioredoxin 1